jgi:hypothetical protein
VNNQKRYVKKKEKFTSASRNILRDAKLFSSGLANLNTEIKRADRLKPVITPLIEQIDLFGREIKYHEVSPVTNTIDN